nr:ATP-binding cassette domain-containing protein [Oceanospirillaceae bacterium]
DEPTAVLTPQEAQALFATLRRLVAEGCAVLYISHRLEEVKQICHDATILRLGQVVAEVDPQVETAATLAQLMVGASVHQINRQANNDVGPVLLELTHLNHRSSTPFGVDLLDINLSVKAGEILAIAGVAGNGQGELFGVISGEEGDRSDCSMVLMEQVCSGLNINQRRQLGAAFVPEERMGHGAVEHLSLTDNILLSRHACADTASPLNRGLMGIDRAQLATLNSTIGRDYDVRKGSEDAQAGALSGGNLQKFVVGRELNRKPKVLVINQPTWGVDAGAAALIRQALIDLSRQGSAILVISQDLDEIFELADTITVISRGQLSAGYAATQLSREDIGLMMAGSHEQNNTESGA